MEVEGKLTNCRASVAGLNPPQPELLTMESAFRAYSVRSATHRGAALRPNPSFNPRLATAGTVSLVRASHTIVAYQAYSTRLRSRG